MMSVENLTYSQTFSHLLQGLADVASQDDVKVTGITSDSRAVNTGDLFIAYKNTDIMAYVKSAIDAGASAIVIESEQLPDIPKYSAPVIALPQLQAQAGLIAARFYKHPSHDMNVIGVTGTNGKTTVSYLIAQALDIKNPGKMGINLIRTERTYQEADTTEGKVEATYSKEVTAWFRVWLYTILPEHFGTITFD